MKKPLIGITTHSSNDPFRSALDQLLAGIIFGIERAGGLPVLIPHGIADATVFQMASRLDGVLLSGGSDIATHYYGLEFHHKVTDVDPWRDRVEIALARQVVEEELPFFGICRGLQALTVAFGGTLHPEVSEVADAQQHTFYPDYPFDRLSHPIQISEDSRLAQIVGAPVIYVNSLHHQAPERVAGRLRVVATAPDGLIEAVEVDDHPFGLAVQWHPEALPNEPSAQALFAAFVRACRP